MLLRLLLGLALSTSLHAEAIIEASGELSATTRDQHGDTVGGIGSGIVYDQKNDTYLCVSDRGPGDGTLPYRPSLCRLENRRAERSAGAQGHRVRHLPGRKRAPP